jgi:hypothetical protein
MRQENGLKCHNLRTKLGWLIFRPNQAHSPYSPSPYWSFTPYGWPCSYGKGWPTGHGLLDVSHGPAMLYPETALHPFQGRPASRAGGLQPHFTLLDTSRHTLMTCSHSLPGRKTSADCERTADSCSNILTADSCSNILVLPKINKIRPKRQTSRKSCKQVRI